MPKGKLLIHLEEVDDLRVSKLLCLFEHLGNSASVQFSQCTQNLHSSSQIRLFLSRRYHSVKARTSASRAMQSQVGSQFWDTEGVAWVPWLYPGSWRCLATDVSPTFGGQDKEPLSKV